MRVKLLKDVLENGQVKTTIRPRRKQVIAWFEGTEMDMSDATAERFIAEGLAAPAEQSGETKEVQS